MFETVDVDQAKSALLRGDVVISGTKRPHVGFLRVGEHTLRLPGGALTAQLCMEPHVFVVNPLFLGRVLGEHAPLRAVPQTPELVAALAPVGALLERSNLLDAMLSELRSGRRFVGGPTTDQAWSVAWNGSTFVKTSPDDDGNEEVTELDEAQVRETMSAFSLCGLDRLRPPLSVNDRQGVLVDVAAPLDAALKAKAAAESDADIRELNRREWWKAPMLVALVIALAGVMAFFLSRN